MKIAILGGSFNPLHIGHAMLADIMVKELGYNKVLFVPTCIPPHKEITGSVSTKDRLGMVSAFCDSVPDKIFEVESCEIERGGISYTVDTVKYILNKYKDKIDGKPALLMGEEIASQFDKWKEPKVLADLVDITIVPRYPDFYGRKLESYASVENKPTGQFAADFAVKFDRSKFRFPCRVLEIPIIPVSSTEIRARIAAGRSYKYLVPEEIYNFIEKGNLYKWVSTDEPAITNWPDVNI